MSQAVRYQEALRAGNLGNIKKLGDKASVYHFFDESTYEFPDGSVYKSRMATGYNSHSFKVEVFGRER